MNKRRSTGSAGVPTAPATDASGSVTWRNSPSAFFTPASWKPASVTDTSKPPWPASVMRRPGATSGNASLSPARPSGAVVSH